MSVFQKLNTLTTSTMRSEKVQALSSVYSYWCFWFFGLNKCQFWCFECFVSQSLNRLLLSRAESKHRQLSVCHRAAASVSRKHDHLISEVISSWELWYRQSVQSPRRLPVSSPFLKSSCSFNGGKNCHEAFVQAHLVQVRRASQPTAAAVLSNLWKPKPSNLGSDAPYSECVWEGEPGTGTCLTLLTVLLSTISQPHLNRF